MEANKNVTILLVEDDPINQFTQKKILQKKNYNVIVAGTGYDALQILQEQKINVVLLDIGLPDIDGLEVIKIIRQRDEEQKKYTPIVVVTAYAMQIDREKSIAAGADEYISKPLSIWELYSILEDIISEE